MSASPLLELKTSDKKQGIKGKILFLCSLCLTTAAVFCDFFSGAGPQCKNQSLLHILRPRILAFFAYSEYTPADINYIYIKEYKGKFQRNFM